MELFARGVIAWHALAKIKTLRWCLGRKTLTKAEKQYKQWSCSLS